jgi:hypothetical protein
VDRITIDTNIYISALNFPGGKPHQLLQMAVEGEVRVAISDAIMAEVLRIMRDKFHATPEDLLGGRGHHHQLHGARSLRSRHLTS